MTIRLLRSLVGLALIVGPLGAASLVSAAQGTSGAAQLCQGTGYTTVFAQDGSQFAGTGPCVSYAAQGGKFAYLHVAHTPGSCQFTTSGYGLLPGSQVTYLSSDGQQGADPGTVAPDGTYSYSNCVFGTGTLFATTAGGATISAPYVLP